jgi:hypothetical protein
MNLQIGSVDQIRTHVPSFPSDGAFETEAIARLERANQLAGQEVLLMLAGAEIPRRAEDQT